MGYRSDVKYVLLFKTQDHRNAFHMEAKLIASDVEHGPEVIDDFDFHYDEHDVDYPYQIRVHYEDVKWYESLPWVTLQEKLMDIVVEGYDGGYAFTRIGEENDDVETKTSQSDSTKYVYADQYIEFFRRSEFV